jgi:hypothetical protein
MLQTVKGVLKTCVKYVVRWKVVKQTHFLDQYSGHSSWASLRIHLRQKRALEYYSSKVAEGEFIDSLIDQEGVLPVVFAHFQPEATSFPEGGDYSNHIDIVLEVRKMGYSGPILYKEHPGSWIHYSTVSGLSQVGLYRSVEYFKQLEKLGCVFLDTRYKISSDNLENLLPVTITGSLGIERSLAGLVTCCAGQPWFKRAPGIVSLYNTFKEGGVLSNPRSWFFETHLVLEWFDKNLSLKTVNNVHGIGTGLASTVAEDEEAYVAEMDKLLRALIESADDAELSEKAFEL